MSTGKIIVTMFGGISITWNGRSITEKDSRSRKTWLLLAYLICGRSRHISQREIMDLLWDEEEELANLQGSLKTTLHRLRTMLNKLEDTAGHQLILRHENSYAWNTAFELDFDVETFDALCHDISSAEEEDGQLALCLQALKLYRGDFLPALQQEPWAAQFSAKYHALYLNVVKTTISILERRSLTADVIQICQQALMTEPLNEEIYEHLLQNLIATGQCEEAAAAYEELSRQLLATLGTMPSESIRSLYWKALRTDNGYTVPVDEICRQLQESQPAPGALFCEYDFFKVLYQAQARAIARTGEEYHISLLSVKARQEKGLSQSSLDLVIRNLQEVICSSVRRGDVATRCSATQFIIMLPRASYESSCMVCSRIIRSFCRQYPHSPAEISAHVFPVEPLK
ncbi:MAG: hypothetical protein IJ443_02175 [Firmicutes bacterium]|nr:hypothetical protein [Bacillota bacterium]